MVAEWVSSSIADLVGLSNHHGQLIVYNRVPKAASSSLIDVLSRLQHRNKFWMRSAWQSDYWPNRTKLATLIGHASAHKASLCFENICVIITTPIPFP